jgi:hypothetical protein
VCCKKAENPYVCRPPDGKHKINILCALCGAEVKFKIILSQRPQPGCLLFAGFPGAVVEGRYGELVSSAQ